MSKEKFIELAKKFEAKRKELDLLGSELESSMKELGVNTYVKDYESGVTYKIIKPEGTFISYRDIYYKRTALEGERGGTILSKKEAEEASANGLV